MKKVIFSLLVFSLLCITCEMTVSAEGSPGWQNPGVIDINRVVADSPKLNKLHEQLKEKGQELKGQLEEAKANLSAEEFQVKQQAVYDEFIQIKQELERQSDELLQQSLAEVVKEKQLTIVLEKRGIVYGGLDITADVIKKLQ